MKTYILTSKVNDKVKKYLFFLCGSKKVLWFQSYVLILFAALFVNLPFFCCRIFLLACTDDTAMGSVLTKILV